MSSNPFFISAQELEGELGSPDLRIVDSSWYLPAMNRDPKAEFAENRLPGAVYFDIDDIADKNSDLPHMLPSPEAFGEAMGRLGLSENDRIVVYDGPGLFSSARGWWSLWVMGARNVRILEGGMDGWKKEGRPLETGEPAHPRPASFQTNFSAGRVRDFDYMLKNLKNGTTIVLDARPYGRFIGQDPEPRPGLRSGHMPGARSMPAIDLVRDGRLLPKEELRILLEDNDVKPGRHVTTTCGSGATAAILTLALEAIGHGDHSLYDGSWADWGSRPNAPVAIWK